jgi:hypothetical protein
MVCFSSKLELSPDPTRWYKNSEEVVVIASYLVS